MKIHKVIGGTLSHLFFCPACKCGHGFNIEPNKSNGVGGTVPVWIFNGDFEKPTIRASILVRSVKNPEYDPATGDFAKDKKGKYLLGSDGRLLGAKDIVCHSFVTDGKIQFLSDCTHGLAGKTVDLEDF
jgi:hypothetical protein